MDEILPNLYLGDWQDALTATKVDPSFTTLCVIETHPETRYLDMGYYVPILDYDDNYHATLPPQAQVSQLDIACDIIDDHILNSEPLLVHCWAGVERSPLTLAYWLVRSKRQSDLDSAYKFLKSKRPIVEDRRVWLPLSLATSL